MLNALRRLAQTFVAKMLIMLLVLSFGVWGVSGFVNQIDPTEVARAGDTQITAAEFDRVYRLQSFRTGQQIGRQLTPQEAQALGLPQQTLQAMVSEALQVDAARRLGVDLGDEALAERIRVDENFAGASGFDRARFNQFLANARYGENEYIDVQRGLAVQEMWVNSLVGGLTAPTAYVEALNRYTSQLRTVAHFTLSDDALGALPDPSEAALRAYHEANKDQFRSPERRTFSLVTLSAEALAEPDAVSADAVRQAYEAGAYGAPEKREVAQVILSDRALAQKAVDAINGGYAFAAILRELKTSYADVNLGTVERTDLLDPSVAEAAFSLEARKAAVVDGRFGPTVVRVGTIEGSGKEPLEAVEPAIRQSLALEEATAQVRSLETSVTDAIAGGAQVAEVADRFGLPTITVTGVDRQGVAADGQTPAIPLQAQVLTTAFGAAAGDDAAPVQGDAETVWVQVDSIEAPLERPFEEVADDVLFGWTAAEKQQRLGTLAESALAALRAGTPIAEVAAKSGADVAASAPFSRGAPPADLPADAATAAFGGPVGHAASVPVADGGVLLLQVATIEEPAFFEEAADLQPIREALDDGLANAVLFDLLSAYQETVGSTVNQPVLNRVVGIDAPPGS